MSVGKDHFLAGTAVGGSQIPQVVDQELDPAVQEIIEAFDGQVDPSYAGILTVMSTMRFSTTAIATVLTAIGISGFSYSGAGNEANMYWQPAAPGGTRDTTACVKVSSAQGMSVVESIEASEGSFATASCMHYPISTDGDTAAVTLSTGVTLPSPVMTRQLFTVGPVKVNGTMLGGVVSTSIRFGLQISHKPEGGSPFPTQAYILTRKPVITVRTTNIQEVAALGLFAAQSTSSKSTVFLRKMAASGTSAARVPNATAQHISFAQSAGLIIARRIPGSKDTPAVAELEFGSNANGTDAITIVNTATAIA